MTRFVHLTDLHVIDPARDVPRHQPDTLGRLRDVMTWIAGLTPAPDFVVVSGDLVNFGDRASYLCLQKELMVLDVPVVLALGNHDSRAPFREVFLGANSDDAPYCHDRVLGDLHVITLDSMVPDKVAGHLAPDQFEFLTGALARHGDLSKLLVMHHPPRIDPGGLPWASLSSESTARLAEILAGQRIAGILSGHIHITHVSHWNGIPVVVPVGLHSSVDLKERNDMRIVEGAGLAFCSWRSTGLSVSFIPLAPQAKELRRMNWERLLRAYRGRSNSI